MLYSLDQALNENGFFAQLVSMRAVDIVSRTIFRYLLAVRNGKRLDGVFAVVASIVIVFCVF